jgi:5'-nucleotidase
MNKKSFGIDLDDTCNCLVEHWVDTYNNEYNDTLKKEDIKDWNIAKYVKPGCDKTIYKMLTRPEFFLNLNIKPNTYEVTKWLLEKVDLYIVTAYHYKTCKDKVKWIIKYLPHIPKENIIFCNNKGLLKLDYLLDDGIHNISDFYNTNPDGVGVIFNEPWNENLEKNYPRVKDWLEVKKFFEVIL